MEIKTLFGLPAHPLLVHIPVVVLPLAAFAALLAVAGRRLRKPFGWSVVVLTGVSVVASKVAASSGQFLQDSVKQSAALQQHTELGDSLWLFALVFFLFSAGFMLADRQRSRPSRAGRTSAPLTPPAWAVPVLAGLMLLVGALATVRVIQVGHSGAKATWQDKTSDVRPVGEGRRRGGG